MKMYSVGSATGEAHSKLILVGEHAVVYGQPAIAIPFPLKVRAQVSKSIGEITISSLLYTGNMEGIPSEMTGISECIKNALMHLNKPLKDINITIRSEIPLGRGLGSSAAVATAIVRGIFFYFNRTLTQEELCSLVEISESHAHGKPSGIDMMAVASNSPIYFKRQEGACSFTALKPLYLVVADSGKIGDTRRAVEKVKKNHLADSESIDAVVNRIGEITEKARETISGGELRNLGSLLHKNHEELKLLGVSNETIDRMVDTAMRAGAIGAKLTGGGMGGCMITLANTMADGEYISKELLKVGASKAWYFSTEGEEIYESHLGNEGEIS